MNKRVHQNNQLWHLRGMGSQPDQIDLRTPTVYILLNIIVKAGTGNDGILFDVFLLSASNILNDALGFGEDLIIRIYLLLFLLIDLLHRSFEKTLHESSHVVDWAVDQELLDKSLTRKRLQ